MPNKPNVKVWLSHDGYRDPDDNLSLLIGGAQARAVEKSSSSVSVAAIVFGDTKDGGQYYMLNPGGKAPEGFGDDPRYDDEGGNRVAAGNHAFFQEYGREALRELSGGWSQYDLLASDDGGRRAWNFDAQSKSALTAAAAALATDIEQAIAKGGQGEVVVYSAGGGANLPAEALGYLLNQGYATSEIKAHFAIVQHGRSNWGNAYEDEARSITNDFTIALSNQNMARYQNGMDGPDLKHALKGVRLDGDAFGDDFAEAFAVATGRAPFQGLDGDASFLSTADASDAGSHAFALDIDRLMNAWDDRMGGSDRLPDGDAWAHRIDGPSGDRLRVIYNEFDARKIADLLDGRSGDGIRRRRRRRPRTLRRRRRQVPGAVRHLRALARAGRGQALRLRRRRQEGEGRRGERQNRPRRRRRRQRDRPPGQREREARHRLRRRGGRDHPAPRRPRREGWGRGGRAPHRLRGGRLGARHLGLQGQRPGGGRFRRSRPLRRPRGGGLGQRQRPRLRARLRAGLARPRPHLSPRARAADLGPAA